MEGLIISLYEDDEDKKEDVEKGAYKLRTESGVIFPQYWELLAQPEWKVTITIDSQNEPDKDTSSSSGPSETVYAPKTTYTVEYYMTGQYSRSRDTQHFLHRMSCDDPVILARSANNARELPVLEEIQPVTIPHRLDLSDLDFLTKHGTELGVNDSVEETKLHIHSPFLLNALRAVIKYSSQKPSGDRNDGLREGMFLHPYADLFYHKEELSRYKTQTTGPRANHTAEYNAECDLHIDILLEYLDKEAMVKLPSAEANMQKKTPTTTFADAWLLMKPGSDVYVREYGNLNAYVVESLSGGVDYTSHSRQPKQVKDYRVRVWNLAWDGEVIRRVAKVIDISIFDNERDIMSLPAFPIRFQDELDGGKRRRQLIERGRKAARFAAEPAFLEYTGQGLKPGWKKVIHLPSAMAMR